MSNPEIQRVEKGKSVTIKADADLYVMVLPESADMPLSKSSAKTRKISHVGGSIPLAIKNPHSESDNNATYNGNIYVDASDDEAIDTRAKIAKAKAALR